MARWFYYMIFLGLPSILHGQDFSDFYTGLLRKELHALPYRDFHLSYSLQYDSLQHCYRLHAPGLREKIDLSEKLNELPVTSAVSYRGEIFFDSYTDSIFISTEVGDGKWHFTTIDIFLQPRGGMENFVNRWDSFIDSLKNIGEYDDENVPVGSTVYFTVDKRGMFSCIGTKQRGGMLRKFLLQETPWTPGIQSGRIFSQRIDLNMTSSLQSQNASSYRRHRICENFLSIKGEKVVVCYTHTLPHLAGLRAVLSAVAIDGGYNTPVFHSGKIDELEILAQFVAKQHAALHGHHSISRVYFYILED